MAENSVNSGQYSYLQSFLGKRILPCWTDIQLDLREANGHIQPNSGACMSARYRASVQPRIVDVKDMEKSEKSPLAKACSACPIMANTILLLQTLDLK